LTVSWLHAVLILNNTEYIAVLIYCRL